MRTSRSPSPLPSPQGRGSHAGQPAVLSARAFPGTVHGRFSLFPSEGETAGSRRDAPANLPANTAPPHPGPLPQGEGERWHHVERSESRLLGGRHWNNRTAEPVGSLSLRERAGVRGKKSYERAACPQSESRPRSAMRWFAHFILFVTLLPAQAAVFTEEFASPPAARGWRTFGDGSLFSWNATSQNLEVTWDSARPNSYFFRPLGTIVGKSDDFSFQFDLRLHSIQPRHRQGLAQPRRMGLLPRRRHHRGHRLARDRVDQQPVHPRLQLPAGDAGQ